MLELTIESREFYNEEKNEFFIPTCLKKDVTIRLEHSLVSISKWESNWKKPFLTREDKTFKEIIDYIKCMTITQNVNPEVYNYLSTENIKTVNAYIEDPMSATTFKKEYNPARTTEQTTSELIYYWMIALDIPPEYQKWHLNRLINLIRICNIKNSGTKKMSKRDILARNQKLNAARRAKYNTSG